MHFSQEDGYEATVRAVAKTRGSWFGKIHSVFRSHSLDQDTWDNVEELLISADVGVLATTRLITLLKDRIEAERIVDSEKVLQILKQEMVNILQVSSESNRDKDMISKEVVMVVGVNGVGKTTSIAKLISIYQDHGKKILIGAADTYRAAAIDQLGIWGHRLGVDVVSHKEGSDPGAVAFDAIQAGKARGVDVVIIDTAGRLHTKNNLMEELSKVKRVLSTGHSETSIATILTIDATTGQNGLSQARAFAEKLNCNGVFLTKLDGTSKGGVVVAIAHELNIPVLYVGNGESHKDVAIFNPDTFIKALFATE